ncbi:MAG: Vacuolar protein-sorting-associated protein 24 [Watsoniomyces obsoletus]|nr:MAG: Vacuolar protein-sorting-associated protein 24 [Watsoniomyces obsoletus]
MSNSSQYPHYYGQPPPPPEYPSQAYPQAPSTAATSRPPSHPSSQSQAPSYPSVSYGQQQYHPPAPAPAPAGSSSNQGWYGVTSAGHWIPIQPTSAQPFSYGEVASYGTSGNHATNRSFGDERGLGSLAYASSLTPSTTTRDNAVRTTESTQATRATPATAASGPRRLRAPATVVPEQHQHQHRPSVAYSGPPSARPHVSAQSPAAATTANATPSTSTPYLQSVVHGYTPQSAQQTPSTSSASDARLGSYPSNQTTTHLPDAGGAWEQPAAYSYRPYSGSREAPVPASTYPTQTHRTNFGTIPANPNQSPATYTPGPVEKYRPHSASSHAPGGPSISHRRAHPQGTTGTAEQRVASPFNIGQFQPPHRVSPLVTSEQQTSPPVSATASSFFPTTVDPSMVYNPYRESQRPRSQHQKEQSVETTRNSTGGAMSSSGAAGGGGPSRETSRPVNGLAPESGTTQVDAGSGSTMLAQSRPGSSAASVPSTNMNPGTASTAQDAEDMEAQMKMMVERMREYQARDPSKFAKVWEEVKKNQPGSSGQAHGAGPARASPQTQTQTLKVPSNRSSLSAGGQAEHLSPAPTQQMSADVHHEQYYGNRATGRSTPQEVPHANTPDVQTTGQGSQVSVGTHLLHQHVPTTTGPAVASATLAPISASAPAAPAPSAQGTIHPTTTEPSAAPAGNTYWPEANKAALAVTAANALMSYPRNAGKIIASSKILELLNGNPSYVQLCETLYDWGFWLDRSEFARALLSTVQGGKTSTTQPAEGAVHNVSTEVGTSAGQPHAMGAGSAQGEAAQSTADAQGTAPPAPKKRGKPRKQKSDIFTGLGKTGAEFSGVATSVPSNGNANQAEMDMPSSQVPKPKAKPRARKNGKSAPSATMPAEAVTNDMGTGMTPDEIFARAAAASVGNESPRRSPRARKTTQTTWPVDYVSGPMMHDGFPQEQIGSSSSVKPGGPVASSISKRDIPQQKGLKLPASSERVRPSPAAPRALTKAEASRKRNFSDIVDLTLDPHMEPQQPAGPMSTPDGLINTPFLPNSTTGVPSAGSTSGEPTRKRPKIFTTPAWAQKKDTGVPMESLWRAAPVAEPIDKTKASERTEYDVKTIARDVLLATGRHPTLGNLNDHLKGLKQRFTCVTDTTDLSTFRWDLVDPLPAEAVEKQKELSTNDSSNDWANNMIDQVVVESSDSAPKLSSSLPHPPASTTPATMGGKKGVSSSGVAASSLTKGASSVPGRRRTQQVRTPDVPDKDTPMGEAEIAQSSFIDNNNTPSATTTPRAIRHRSKISPNTPSTTTPQRALRHRSKIPPNTPVLHPFVIIPSPRIKKPLVNIPRAQSPSISVSVHTPNRPGPIHENDNENGPPSGATGDATGPAATEGAPSIRSSTTPTVPVASQHMTTKEVSFDINPPEPAKDLPLSIFKCLWEGCQAELHNIDILRRHIRKIHSTSESGDDGNGSNGRWPCLWTTCELYIDRSLPEEEQQQEGKKLVFGTEKDWFEHVNDHHVRGYAKKFGDGPSLQKMLLRPEQKWKPSELLLRSTFEGKRELLAGGGDTSLATADGMEIDEDYAARLAVLGDGSKYVDEDLEGDFTRGLMRREVPN